MSRELFSLAQKPRGISLNVRLLVQQNRRKRSNNKPRNQFMTELHIAAFRKPLLNKSLQERSGVREQPDEQAYHRADQQVQAEIGSERQPFRKQM